MEKIDFYHFDRRRFIKENLRQAIIFKNNEGKLNGFFMNLMLSPQTKLDFGQSLFNKICDYLFGESIDFDFQDELIKVYESKKDLNIIIKKVFFELHFENVRRKNYNSLPSRMKSIFLMENMEDIEFWKNHLAMNGTIYKFSAPKEKIDKTHHADANWFELCDINKINNISKYANNYWQGKMSSNEKPEILAIGEFTCEVLSEN